MCSDLMAAGLKAKTRQVTLKMNMEKPPQGEEGWPLYYAGSALAGAQAIFYYGNCTECPEGEQGEIYLALLNELDEVKKTTMVKKEGGAWELVRPTGVRFTHDGQAVIVSMCAPPGAEVVKYSLPDLTELWRSYMTREQHVRCGTLSGGNHLSVGHTRVYYHHQGYHGGHQSDVVFAWRVDNGEYDPHVRDKHASHSWAQMNAFNPHSGNTHIVFDAGDAFPEKLAVSAYYEPEDIAGKGRDENIIQGGTVFQGHNTHFGAVVPSKGEGFAAVVSFTGQQTKFGGPDDGKSPPKVFFGTYDKDAWVGSCPKPVFGGGGQQKNPTLVALAPRRYLMAYNQGSFVVLDQYGQIRDGPVQDLPAMGSLVNRLVETRQGISWISRNWGSEKQIKIHRIMCKPMEGGDVFYWN